MYEEEEQTSWAGSLTLNSASFFSSVAQLFPALLFPPPTAFPVFSTMG